MDEMKVYLKNMLNWFHIFCRENKITYYALGGTLLGALRHGGFIPWDDDIDVGVPRPDYERLIQLLKDRSGRYELETPQSGAKDFCYTFSKLYDTTTTLVENTKSKTKRGIYIDIFPIDGMGNTREEAISNYQPLKRLFDFYIARTVDIKKDRSFIKNAIVMLLKPVPQFIINDRKIQLKICELCRRYDYDKSLYCGNTVGVYHEKEIVEKSIFGTPRLVKFEDIEINAPEKAEEYLECIYGSWRELPPPDKRNSNHNFAQLNLHKPYSEK